MVEENKHFTTPSKFLNEFPVALKAENEKDREELEKMQDCGKQMGVLALNAAIEAGRMGEEENSLLRLQKRSVYLRERMMS